MNAPVDIAEQRAERRRQTTMFNMRGDLLSLKLDLDRVGTLGNDAAAVAMRTFNAAVAALHQKGQTLQVEFYELAEHEQRQSEREQGQKHGNE